MTNTSPINVVRDENGTLKLIDMVRPSNFHAHARSGDMMQTVANDLMWWVKYLLLMPNTGPIDTKRKVIDYYNQLLSIRHDLGHEHVELIMTVYLTSKLDWRLVKDLAALPFKVEVKYYPPHKGATTGSGLGIPLMDVPDDTWRAMIDANMPLLGHFESVEDTHGNTIDMVDREGYFMDHEFLPFRERWPDLHVNIEHASTAKSVAHVNADKTGNTTCGFTPHHLILTIDNLRRRSWANHGKCMPIPKGYDDMMACREFAISGDRRANGGDDSAPHPESAKVGDFWDPAVACGCWLPHSLALYAWAFEQEKALDERFVAFACHNGALWRGLELPENSDRVRLVADTEHDIPDPLILPDGDRVIPLGWTEEPDRLKIGLAMQLEQELAV